MERAWSPVTPLKAGPQAGLVLPTNTDWDWLRKNEVNQHKTVLLDGRIEALAGWLCSILPGALVTTFPIAGGHYQQCAISV